MHIYSYRLELGISLLQVEGQRGLELGTSLSLGHLGSDKTLADQALINQFPLRIGLIRKNRVLLHFSKGFLFPSLCWKQERISDSYSRKLTKFLEVDLTILRRTTYDWLSLKFLTLKIVLTDLLDIGQLQFAFYAPLRFSLWFQLMSLCPSKLICTFACVSLQSCGQQFALFSSLHLQI